MYRNEEEKFEAIQLAVEGSLVRPFDAVAKVLLDTLESINSYEHDAGRAANSAHEALRKCLDRRSEAIVKAYVDALHAFGISRLSPVMAESIREHSKSLIEQQVKSYRAEVERTSNQLHVKFEPTVVDSVAGNAILAVTGKMEIVLNKLPKPASHGDKSTSKWVVFSWTNIFNPLYVSGLGLAALFVQKSFLDARTADRERRITEQQAVAKEVVPALDSIARIIDQLGPYLPPRDSTGLMAETIERMNEETLNKMSLRNRIVAVYGLGPAALLDAIRSDIAELDAATGNKLNPRSSLSSTTRTWQTIEDEFRDRASRLELALIAGVGK